MVNILLSIIDAATDKVEAPRISLVDFLADNDGLTSVDINGLFTLDFGESILINRSIVKRVADETIVGELKRVLLSLECSDSIVDTIYPHDANPGMVTAWEILFSQIVALGYDSDKLEAEVEVVRSKGYKKPTDIVEDLKAFKCSDAPDSTDFEDALNFGKTVQRLGVDYINNPGPPPPEVTDILESLNLREYKVERGTPEKPGSLVTVSTCPAISNEEKAQIGLSVAYYNGPVKVSFEVLF